MSRRASSPDPFSGGGPASHGAGSTPTAGAGRGQPTIQRTLTSMFGGGRGRGAPVTAPSATAPGPLPGLPGGPPGSGPGVPLSTMPSASPSVGRGAPLSMMPSAPPSVGRGLAPGSHGPGSGPSGYQPTLHQMTYGQAGVEAYQKAVSGAGAYTPKTFYGAYRLEAEERGSGSSGWDELVRTAATRDTVGQLHNAGAFDRATMQSRVHELSMHRVNTDALVWYNQLGAGGAPTEMGAHPGALRTAAQRAAGRGTHNKGHSGRDAARAAAAMHEYDQQADATHGLRRAVTRAQVETVRTMSTPYERFQALGHSGEDLFHARAGDLRNAGNFDRMAAYVHDNRERLKWDAAGRMMGTDMQPHVPPIMAQYLGAAGDHHEAMARYQDDLRRSASAASSLVMPAPNAATTSQAGALRGDETLHGTAAAVTAGTRARALSNPRQMREVPDELPPLYRKHSGSDGDSPRSPKSRRSSDGSGGAGGAGERSGSPMRKFLASLAPGGRGGGMRRGSDPPSSSPPGPTSMSLGRGGGSSSPPFSFTALPSSTGGGRGSPPRGPASLSLGLGGGSSPPPFSFTALPWSTGGGRGSPPPLALPPSVASSAHSHGHGGFSFGGTALASPPGPLSLSGGRGGPMSLSLGRGGPPPPDSPPLSSVGRGRGASSPPPSVLSAPRPPPLLRLPALPLVAPGGGATNAGGSTATGMSISPPASPVQAPPMPTFGRGRGGPPGSSTGGGTGGQFSFSFGRGGSFGR